MDNILRRATVTDIPEIISILELHIPKAKLEGMEMKLSILLKNHGYYTLYIDNDYTTFITVERVGEFKAQIHVNGKKGSGGKRLKQMMNFVVEDLKKDKEYTCLIAFVSSDQLAGKIIAKSWNMIKIGEIMNAGGMGHNEILYSITIGEN